MKLAINQGLIYIIILRYFHFSICFIYMKQNSIHSCSLMVQRAESLWIETVIRFYPQM